MGRGAQLLAIILVCTSCRMVAPRPDVPWQVHFDERTEEATVARSVVDRLVVFAQLAKRPSAEVTLRTTATGFEALIHRAEGDSRLELPLAPHVFAGATWAPLATVLLGEPNTAADATLILPSLEGDFSTANLSRHVEHVSAALRDSPLRASLHESAALLAVALAMRDSGPLADPRELVALATAHLAVARGVPTADGRFAAAMVAAMAGREEDALAAVDPSRRALLSLWIAGDWRSPRVGDGPLVGLERVVRFRAIALRGDGFSGARLLDEQSAKEPLWGRLVYAAWFEASMAWSERRFAEGQVERERADAQSLWVVRRADDTSFNVIPTETWRRHLVRMEMGAALIEHRFLAGRLADERAASERLDQADEHFAYEPAWLSARLLRLGQRNGEECALGKPHLEQLTPARRWDVARLCRLPRFTPDASLRNTAWDADLRLEAPLAPFTPAQADSLAALAPSSLGPRLAKLRALSPASRTGDRMVSMLGPLVDYDVSALRAASRLDSRSRELLDRSCALAPSTCGALVDFLNEHDRPEVIEVLERMRSDAPSRFHLARYGLQLLSYYFAEHRLADASALGRELVASESDAAWEVQAIALERVGEFEKAEEAFGKYDSAWGLQTQLDFHVRAMDRKDGGGAWLEKGRAAERAIFEGRPQRATKKSLRFDELNDGVLLGVGAITPEYRHFGFHAGDTVLIADGVRVRTRMQYVLMLHRSASPTLSVVVLRGGQLLELSGPFERLQFSRVH